MQETIRRREGEEDDEEEVQDKKMVDKVRRKHCKSKEQECRKEAPQSKTNPGEEREVAPSPFAGEAERARCQRCSKMTAEKDGDEERIQQVLQVKGGRWAEEIPQRWRQPKGEDSKMKNEVK